MHTVKPPAVLRGLARLGAICVVAVLTGVVGTQFAAVIGRNVELAHELTAARADVIRLEAARVQRERDIRRLSDPAGAIPEIHEKLRMVGDREAVVYLRGRSAK